MGIKTTCRAGGPFNYQFLHLEYEGDELCHLPCSL